MPVSDTTATTRSLIHGGLWSLAAKVVPQIYLVVVSIAAARLLGPEGLGRQSFIAFAQLSLLMLASGGLPLAVMRYVGENRGRGQGGVIRDLIGWAWRIELAAAAAAGSILVCVGLFGAQPRAAWVLAAVAAIAGILHTVPSALLIGTQRWRDASIVGLCIGAFATIATVAVLIAGGGISGMFAVEAAASILGLAWTQRLARRTLSELAPAAVAAVEVRRQVLRYAGVASVSVGFGFVVWRRSELFFLARYSGDVAIALYSVAFAATTALGRLFEAFAAMLTPAVATRLGAGELRAIELSSGRAFRLTLVASVPLTALAIALGPATLVLAYGDRMAAAGTVLVVLLTTFPIVCLGTMGRALLHGFGRQRVLLFAGAAGAATNIALGIILIPSFGALGAAVANCGAQLVYSVPILVSAARAMGGIPLESRRVGTLVCASLAAAAASWVVSSLLRGPIGVIAGLFVGTVASVVLIALWRAVAVEDAAFLRAAIRSILHTLAERREASADQVIPLS